MAARNPSSFPSLHPKPRVDEWRLVIKVKYGDTLRRFGANINGRSMDHNMSSIKAKITELFKFSPEADLILTYTDEDGDSVALEEDEELNDAVLSQRLDPLRINVQLKTVESLVPKTPETADSTQSLSQLIETTLNTNPAVAEALKSVPEPLRAIVSKVSQDLVVKASSLPALAQLIQLYGPGSPNGPVGGLSSASRGPTNSATGEPKSAIVPVPETADAELNSKQKGKASIAQGLIVATPMPVDLNLDPPTKQIESELPSPNDSELAAKLRTLNIKLKEGLENRGGDAPGGKSTVASPAALTYQFPQASSVGATEVPVGWTTMEVRTSPRSSRVPSYYPRSLTGSDTLHRGVQCDGCGMYPITGPRFKSIVKENYDLCRYCFSNMGNEAEYTRMERPVSQCPYFNGGEAKRLHGRYTGPSRPPKLESLFVKDVTVIDGTVMLPGTPFTKIWRMRNNGTIAWPLGTHLLWTGGSPLGARELNIEVPNNGCPVDHEIDIAIDLMAPSEPGRYTSFWRLVTSSGETFGQRIWVQIEVEKPKTSSANDGSQHVLNLNLPPQISDHDLFGIIDMNAVPSRGAFTQTNFPEPWDMPVVAEPTNESLAPHPDVRSLSVFSEVTTETAETAQAEAAAADNLVEQAMLKELEAMGFMHIDLNKEVLRENKFDLEQSVVELCDLAEWDPLLTELQGMGFHDKKRNKKLLVKNGGSIKRVVLDLISGEEQDESSR